VHSDERSQKPDPESTPPDALINLVRTHVGRVTQAQSRRGWQLLQERSLSRKPQRRWLVGLALVPALAALFLWMRTPASPALGFRITSGQWDAGQLRAPSATPASMAFSDGTEFRLAPGTHGVLGEVDAHGAVFDLKQGHMDLNVTRRSGARWAVDAGPFKISVIGTRFSVDWQEKSGRLKVALHKGEVHVSGPPIAGVVKLAVGQQLQVDVAEREVRIAQIADDTKIPDVAPDVVPDLVVDPVIEPATSPSADVASARWEPPKDNAPDSWTRRVSNGDFEGVVAIAESSGLQSALEKRSAADLGALADSARYQRRTDVAFKALMALRRRYASHALAREAAFHLGRIHETNGDRKAALGWYNQYLKEAPRGVFVAEALGRQMEGTAHLQGRSFARPLAEQYLRRFPGGDFAETARVLIEIPMIK